MRLAYHWVQKTTHLVVVFDGNRSELYPGIDSNATRLFAMAIVAPSEPGDYILQTTLVQEGVCWFEDVHRAILQEFPVRVGRYGRG